jgi:hypothetical protein
MGGGLLQLVAYGAQDVYLTGNPQITFFKVVYRRHTNFAMEAIQQTFNGTPGFGQTVYCQISRNGDLIHRTYLQVNVPALNTYDFSTYGAGIDRYVHYLGLRLIKSVTIEIGGQQIDKHYSDWLYIWNELSLPHGKKHGWNTMVGADSDIISSRHDNGSATATVTKNVTSLFIPLEFWFCRNIGLALPLIALQYHEVKLKLELETIDNCVYATNSTGNTTATCSAATKTQLGSTLDATMWVDYIFLDTDERRRFAQLSHEYLIEQLQFTGQENISASANRIKLNFNHPCKEIIWVAKPTNANVNHWYNYTSDTTNAVFTSLNNNDPNTISSFQFGTRNTSAHNTELFDIINTGLYQHTSNLIYNINPSGPNPFSDGLIQLNGNDRFNKREGAYFNYVQPYQHHTNIPSNKGINVYSFALKPEEHQPSGTLNMSRIDTAVLSVTSSVSGSINIYAVNYNVLRILSGMGGLAYSN